MSGCSRRWLASSVDRRQRTRIGRAPRGARSRSGAGEGQRDPDRGIVLDIAEPVPLGQRRQGEAVQLLDRRRARRHDRERPSDLVEEPANAHGGHDQQGRLGIRGVPEGVPGAARNIEHCARPEPAPLGFDQAFEFAGQDGEGLAVGMGVDRHAHARRDGRLHDAIIVLVIRQWRDVLDLRPEDVENLGGVEGRAGGAGRHQEPHGCCGRRCATPPMRHPGSPVLQLRCLRMRHRLQS